VIRTFDASLKS